MLIAIFQNPLIIRGGTPVAMSEFFQIRELIRATPGAGGSDRSKLLQDLDAGVDTAQEAALRARCVKALKGQLIGE
ncbi:hypothetical protein [Dongia sp.]|uniref:hypothetical protein n=1 Tax=Dongia sp. TaxID=1977262 RepID=UPI0035AEF3CD